MLVTLHGDVKGRHSKLEGHYILQTDPVNEKPCWVNEGGTAIWYHKHKTGYWRIEHIKNLGTVISGICSPDDVEDPLQALTWEYYDGDYFIESKDILVTRPGNI